jgi:hypothetical protein
MLGSGKLRETTPVRQEHWVIDIQTIRELLDKRQRAPADKPAP